MIQVDNFLKFLKKNKINFFTGVPDSLLKNFCLSIEQKVDRKNHIISANEGSAMGIAAGYHLATNKIPLIYTINAVMTPLKINVLTTNMTSFPRNSLQNDLDKLAYSPE